MPTENEAREECCFEAVASLLALAPDRFRMVAVFWIGGEDSIQQILAAAWAANTAQRAQAKTAAPGACAQKAAAPPPAAQAPRAATGPYFDWGGQAASSNQLPPKPPPPQQRAPPPQWPMAERPSPPPPQWPMPERPPPRAEVMRTQAAPGASGAPGSTGVVPSAGTAPGVSIAKMPETRVEAKTNLQTMEQTITITVTQGMVSSGAEGSRSQANAGGPRQVEAAPPPPVAPPQVALPPKPASMAGPKPPSTAGPLPSHRMLQAAGEVLRAACHSPMYVAEDVLPAMSARGMSAPGDMNFVQQQQQQRRPQQALEAAASVPTTPLPLVGLSALGDTSGSASAAILTARTPPVANRERASTCPAQA